MKHVCIVMHVTLVIVVMATHVSMVMQVWCEGVDYFLVKISEPKMIDTENQQRKELL